MADEKEKRTLLGDIKKNIIDKIGNEDIMEGDITRYKVPKNLPEVPIKTIERGKKKVIENESEFENAFNYAMEKAYDRSKLPTKYTKEGLLQAALTFNPTTMPSMLEKYRQDQDPEVKKKRKYVEGYTDIAKSIMRGGPNFVRSASEFVLTPIDYVFDSDFQTKFNKMMDTKEVLGEAETLPGALSELLAEYAIPVSAATKVVNGAKTWKQIKNLQQFMGTSKASKIAQRMGRDATILGLSEVAVRSGSDPNEDYGLEYKIPFTDISAGQINKPESTKGLTGSDLALATIKNKFRYAREGTLLGGGFPLVGKALQQTYKYAAKPVIKGGLNVAGKTMGGVAKVASMDKYVLPNMAKGLRYAAVKPLEKVVAPIIIGAWTKTNPLKVAKQLPPFAEWRM